MMKGHSMQAIDCHFHFFPEAFLKAARTEGNSFKASIERSADGTEFLVAEGDFRHELVPNFYDADTIVQDLDRRKLTSAVITSAPPTLSYWADSGAAIELSQAINEEMAQRAAQYPTRFTPLGALPLQDMDASIKEAKRAVRELKLTGFMIGSNVGGINLDDPYFAPMWETIAELDVPLFIHPYIPAGAERMRRYYLHNLIGMVNETAIAIASVIYGGLLETYPNLRLCFAHAGGTYPFIQGRLDQGYRVRPEECGAAIPHPPSHYLGKLYFDSISFSDSALRFLADLVGSDHMVIGSDYPFDMGPEQPVDAILSNPYLSEDEKADIVGRTASQLYGIPQLVAK
jgi:aminocarboxymuconate-semialdehyde decarboxylase